MTKDESYPTLPMGPSNCEQGPKSRHAGGRTISGELCHRMLQNFQYPTYLTFFFFVCGLNVLKRGNLNVTFKQF